MPKPITIDLESCADPVYGFQRDPNRHWTVPLGNYIPLPDTTYAKALHKLETACRSENYSPHPQFVRDNGSTIYRPLTCKETLEARVIDYETILDRDGRERSKEERLALFKEYSDTCSAIVNKKDSSKFKLIAECPYLVTLPENFKQSVFAINYGSLTSGIELDRNDGGYDCPLRKQEVFNHKAWRAAVEEDVYLLRVYCSIVYAECGTDTAMEFSPGDNTIGHDHLLPVCVHDLETGSAAGIFDDLNLRTSFLRVAKRDT